MVHLKLMAVFTMILGMHAFFNTLKFPAIHVVLYYALMGVWFGGTLAIEKSVGGLLQKKNGQKIAFPLSPFYFQFYLW